MKIKRIVAVVLTLMLTSQSIPYLPIEIQGNKVAFADTSNEESTVVEFAGGDGTEENPYQVASAEQLDAVRNNLSAYYIQVADIDLAGREWEPIGYVSSANDQSAFTGSYDGNGYVISNMTISSMTADNVAVGLFSYSTGEITNVTLTDIDIDVDLSFYLDAEKRNATPEIGGVAAWGNTVSQCSVSGIINVTGVDYNLYIGGIAGRGKCSSCVNYVDIQVEATDKYTKSGHVNCGGIVGHSITVNGEIEKCVNYGDIYASANSFLYCRGISGEYGAIESCINYGDVSGEIVACHGSSTFAGNCNVGGIVGATSSDKNDGCANFGNISAGKTCDSGSCYAGGIAGYIGYYGSGTVSNCYNLGGKITADSSAGRIAGNLISSKTSDCYSLDTTTANGEIPDEAETGATTKHGASLTEDEITALIASILEELEDNSDVTEKTFTMTTYCDGEVISMTETYSDSYFADSAYNYNHDLARLSLGLELSSWTATVDFWGEEQPSLLWSTTVAKEDTSQLAAKRYSYIASAYSNMGFTSAKYYNYGITLNDTSDKVAFSVAKKTIEGDTTLVAVVIRGGNYGAEWISNFNVGDGTDYHEGFNTAAESVYESVLEYIADIDGDIKLWITGYSRGAAVANLLSAKLDDYAEASSERFDAEDIYAYTFATPQGVTNNQNASAFVYQNIFNIVNPGDVVPAVALSGWGFTRYGVTKYFNKDAEEIIFDAVDLMYSYYTGDDTFSSKENINQDTAVTALSNLLLKTFPTAESSGDFLNVIQDVMTYANTKTETDGNWDTISIDDYYDTLELRYGSAKITAALVKTEKFYATLADPLKNLLNSDIVKLLFVLCELNNVNCDEVSDQLEQIAESAVFSSVLCDLLESLPNGFSEIAAAHTAATYLAWMSMDEEFCFSPDIRGTVVINASGSANITVRSSSGEIVAIVTDNEIIESAVPVVINGDTISVYLSSSEEYDMEITAADSGSMNYTVAEMDLEQNILNRVNYYDIELTEGVTYTGSIYAGEEYTEGQYDLTYYVEDEAVRVSASEVLDADYEVTVTVETVGNGVTVGTGTYCKGDTAVLKAYADDNAKFVGWYSDGELLSEDAVYSMFITKDTDVTALFETVFTYGDVNDDGEIDVSDALAILKAYVKLSTFDDTQMSAADVDGSGSVDVSDALYVLRYYVGLIDSFPVE